jgi:hypothetical protein
MVGAMILICPLDKDFFMRYMKRITPGGIMAVAERVQRHRDKCRNAGLRLVQIWIPDTKRPDFAAECKRQSGQVAQADMNDPAMLDFMDAALTDAESWQE